MTKYSQWCRLVTFQNGTQYYGMGSGAGDTLASETKVQSRYDKAGTLDHLKIYVGANYATGSDTYKSRVNAANGNLIVTVTGTSTGLFEDTTNSDSISAGDDLALQEIIASSFHELRITATTFNATSDTSSTFTQLGGNFNSPSTTAYGSLSGTNGWDATESKIKIETPEDITFSGYFVYVNTNARTTTTTYKSRDNGADGNCTVNFTSGQTGFKEDTTNSDSLTAGDDIAQSITTGTGSELLTHGNLGGTITSTGAIPLLSMSIDLHFPDSTRPKNVTGGQSSTTFVSEASLDQSAYVDGTWSDLWVNVTVNSLSTASTNFISRLNAGDGNLIVTYTAGQTGEKRDTTNSDTLVDTDDINYEIATLTGGTGSMNWTGMSSLITEDVGLALVQLAEGIRRDTF